MAEPLVLNLSFSRFDAELATNADLWNGILSRSQSNSGYLTIVLTDRTLYDVSIICLSREQVRSYAALYGIDASSFEDEWDLFWRVVDELLSRSDYDGYVHVPPEVSGGDFGCIILYKLVNR